MTRDQEIAWAAGLFEGEGTAGIQGRPESSRHKPNVLVALVMCDEDAVRRFGAIVGVGKVEFKPRGKPHWSDQWRWRASASDAMHALDMLFPYLCQRRQAKVVQIRAFVSETPSICREWRRPTGAPSDRYPRLEYT